MSHVLTGLDLLLTSRLDLLRGLRLGLVTNPTGITRDIRVNLDALLAAGVDIRALFGPEHGFTSHVEDALPVASGLHRRSGLPVYSLYGAIRKPTVEMLRGLDGLLFDIQDVGVRFYTYTWTLTLCLEAAAEQGLKVFVLDRPNPITGLRVEGPFLEPGYESFVGLRPVAQRHGLTIGEMARLANAEYGIGADLTVVPLDGWRRGMWYDETGLPWVSPSPNIPTFDTTMVYPGTCLVEGTTLSEGRGTTRPFELIGAPWLDGEALADRLNERDLPGARFRPASFTPSFAKYEQQVCHGVQLHVVDRDRFDPIPAALHLIAATRELAPSDFGWLPRFNEGDNPFDLLIGNGWARSMLDTGAPVKEIVARWQDGLQRWQQVRERYLLYD